MTEKMKLEAYSVPPHMIGFCKLRKTKLDGIFFLFLPVGVDDFSQHLNKLLSVNTFCIGSPILFMNVLS